MVVVGIVSILAAMAVPSFTGMLAEQRVRSAASELMGDLVTARIEAIKQQRSVLVTRTGASWKDGWQILVNGAPVKTFNGFGGNTLKFCTFGAEFSTNITFRGDGSIDSTIGAQSGLRISDGLTHSRDILISPAGRVSVDVLSTGAGLVCP